MTGDLISSCLHGCASAAPDAVHLLAGSAFLTGLTLGACIFGSGLGIVGWCIGRSSAMSEVNSWIRKDEVHGDVPNLPPVRERRPIATTPGRWV